MSKLGNGHLCKLNIGWVDGRISNRAEIRTALAFKALHYLVCFQLDCPSLGSSSILLVDLLVTPFTGTLLT